MIICFPKGSGLNYSSWPSTGSRTSAVLEDQSDTVGVCEWGVVLGPLYRMRGLARRIIIMGACYNNRKGDNLELLVVHRKQCLDLDM